MSAADRAAKTVARAALAAAERIRNRNHLEAALIEHVGIRRCPACRTPTRPEMQNGTVWFVCRRCGATWTPSGVTDERIRNLEATIREREACNEKIEASGMIRCPGCDLPTPPNVTTPQAEYHLCKRCGAIWVGRHV